MNALPLKTPHSLLGRQCSNCWSQHREFFKPSICICHILCCYYFVSGSSNTNFFPCNGWEVNYASCFQIL